jgi:hypothetical protein
MGCLDANEHGNEMFPSAQWVPAFCDVCKEAPASRTRAGGAYIAVVDDLEKCGY